VFSLYREVLLEFETWVAPPSNPDENQEHIMKELCLKKRALTRKI